MIMHSIGPKRIFLVFFSITYVGFSSLQGTCIAKHLANQRFCHEQQKQQLLYSPTSWHWPLEMILMFVLVPQAHTVSVQYPAYVLLSLIQILLLVSVQFPSQTHEALLFSFTAHCLPDGHRTSSHCLPTSGRK